MALFDRFRRSLTSNSVNGGGSEFVHQTYSPWGVRFDAGAKYSDAYRWMVLRVIFDGFRNVLFFTESKNDNARLSRMIDFVHTNFETIWMLYFTYGFIVLDADVLGNVSIPEYGRLQFDRDGYVIGYDIVYYSPEFLYGNAGGKSAFGVLRESLKAIGVYKSADIYLTETFGTVGILSGKEMPISINTKKELDEQLRSDYGIGRDKRKFIVSTKALDFKSVQFPVKDLDLQGRIREELKLICNYFNVPFDLIAFSGASTYANQEQATKNFYRNCIAPMAEIILTILRYYVRRTPNGYIAEENISFKIDNVPELADDRTADVEYKTKLADLIAKMESLGIDTEEYKKQFKIEK